MVNYILCKHIVVLKKYEIFPVLKVIGSEDGSILKTSWTTLGCRVLIARTRKDQPLS